MDSFEHTLRSAVVKFGLLSIINFAEANEMQIKAFHANSSNPAHADSYQTLHNELGVPDLDVEVALVFLKYVSNNFSSIFPDFEKFMEPSK